MAGIVTVTPAAAQPPSARLLEQDAAPFALEVASVRRNTSDEPGPRFSSYGEGARIQGITVQLMMEIAYNVHGFQIDGAPDWIRSDRYDVIATLAAAGGNPRGRRLPDILRAVLVERFGLTFHRDTREGSTYALAIAPGGSKLSPATGLRPMTISANTGYLSGTMELSVLSNWLSWRLERPVANRTGLAETFDIELVWTPDTGQATGSSLPAPPPPPPPPSAASAPLLPVRQPPPLNPSGPSIFTAIQEQLGLRIDSVRGPVEMLIVDTLQRPPAD